LWAATVFGVIKGANSMETRKTHFEQIPVATVKKIAYEFPVSEIADHTPDVDVSNAERWREVALRVQGETDSEKLLELVQELIEKYDEEKTKKKDVGQFAMLGCRQRLTVGRNRLPRINYEG
jgi:hypothetical protein